MPDASRSARWILPLKIALLALLTVNTAYYLCFGTPSEALDSPAWLVLLISYEVETGLQDRFGGRRATVILRRTRWVAAAALLVAAAGYVHDKDWLDALNVGLWIAVVALLEFKLRHPNRVRRSPRKFAAAAAVLYASLIALMATWWLRQEWFAAYDAALWLAAFAIVELDLLGRTEDGAPAT